MKMEMIEKMIKRSAIPVFIIWLVSVLCYLPFIVKGLTNSVDGLWAPTYYQSGNVELGSGRWVLLFLDKGRGAYAAEPFSSFLALFFVSLAVYITITIFTEVNYRTFVYAILVPCSTTICCYLAYRFTSANYGLSIMMSVLAAWMITRETVDRKKSIVRFLLTMAEMVISLGIYQANLGCFCVIVIIYMLKTLLDGDNQKCYCLLKRVVVVGITSCIFYKIAWDLCLKARHISASSYNGADSISIGSMILGMPHSLWLIYRSWLSYFSYSDGYYVFRYVRILLVLAIFIFVISIGIMKLHQRPKSLTIYILLCLCLPIGANVAVILAPAAKAVMTQMTAPVMLVIPVLLLYLDGLRLKNGRLLVVLGVLLLYGNIYAVGTDIEALSQGSNTTYAIMSNIISDLDQEELLSGDYEYAFYGNPSENKLFKTNELYENASLYAKFGKLQTKTDMIRNAYMGMLDDIGIDLEFVEYDTYKEILDSDLLDSMPAFPAKGSVCERNGVVVVKVSEDYK